MKEITKKIELLQALETILDFVDERVQYVNSDIEYNQQQAAEIVDEVGQEEAEKEWRYKDYIESTEKAVYRRDAFGTIRKQLEKLI